MPEGFSSSDLKVSKQCNAFPDKHSLPSSSIIEKDQSWRSPSDATEKPHNATNHLPIDHWQKWENAESFIKPCKSFSLPNRIERTSKNRGNSYEGHQINAVSSPYDTSPQARGNYEATIESSNGSESNRKLLIVREMSIEGEQCQI